MLAIVLGCDEDFSLVTENHPGLLKHKYYDPSASFPDLSSYPPSREDCWWQDLGARHASLELIPFSHHEATAAETLQEPVTSKEPKERVTFEEPAVPREPTAPAALVTPATPTAPKKLTALEVRIPVSKFKILPPKRGGKKKGDDEEIEGSQGERVSTYCLFLFLSDCSGRSLSANASERLLKRSSPPKGLTNAMLQRRRHKPTPQSTQIPMDLLGSPLSPSILRFVLFINSIRGSQNRGSVRKVHR